MATSEPRSSGSVDIWPATGVFESGSMYMYICVVKRFGTFVGVTQRVNGIKPSAKISQPSHTNCGDVYSKIRTDVGSSSFSRQPLFELDLATVDKSPTFNPFFFGDLN